MNTSLISLSFDDGRLDSYTVALPILKKYVIPATFNIATGYVENIQGCGWFTDVNPMSIDMVKDIYNDKNYEIAGHGFRHKNDCEDILEGLRELKRQLDTKNLTHFGDGFASPGSDLEKQVWERIYNKGNLVYARVSFRYKCNRLFKILCRKANRVFHLPLLYRLAYMDTLMDNVRNGIIYSIPVLSSVTLDELKSLVSYSEKHKKACTLMFHSIVPEGAVHDNWDFSANKFDSFCKFLSDEQQKGRLKVCTTMDLFNQLM